MLGSLLAAFYAACSGLVKRLVFNLFCSHNAQALDTLKSLVYSSIKHPDVRSYFMLPLCDAVTVQIGKRRRFYRAIDADVGAAFCAAFAASVRPSVLPSVKVRAL